MQRCIMCMAPVSDQLTTHSRRGICERSVCWNDLHATGDVNSTYAGLINWIQDKYKYRVTRPNEEQVVATDDWITATSFLTLNKPFELPNYLVYEWSHGKWNKLN